MASGRSKIPYKRTISGTNRHKLREMAANQKDDYFRSLIENSLDITIILDEDGTIRYGSPSLKKALGYELEYLTGRNVFSFIHPDEVEGAASALKKTMTDPNNIQYMEYRVRHRDGSWVYLDVVGKSLLGNPLVNGIVINSRDITERKEAEIRNKIINRLLKQFTEATSRKEYLDAVTGVIQRWSGCGNVGIRLLDSEGNIPFESFLGYSPEFMKSEKWLSIREHNCFCVKMVAGDLNTHERSSYITPGGSFYCNNIPELVEGLTEKDRAEIRETCAHFGFSSVAVIPIGYRGKRIGVIHLADQRKSMAPLKTMEVVELMTPLVGEAVHRFNMEEEIKLNYNIQGVINSILLLSLENLSLDEILARSLQLIISAPWFNFQASGAIFIAEGNPKVLVMRARNGLSKEIEKACSLVPFGKCLCGRAATELKVQFAGGIVECDGVQPGGFPPHSHYCIPIQSGGMVLGVISLRLKNSRRRSQRDEDFLTVIANTLAGIIGRRRSEEALQRSEASLAKAQQIANMGYWRWDVKANEMYWSEQIYHIFGLNRKETELTYESFLKSVHPEDREKVVNTDKEALNDNKPFRLDYRIVLPDGSERFVHSEGEMILNADSVPVEINGTVQDITDRKRAEERLQKLNRAFLSLGADFEKNISLLTEACGDLLGAACAIYNRIEDGLLCSAGSWNTPAGYSAADKPDGLVCYEVIKRGREGGVLLVSNLPETAYFETDPNVASYGLKTYAGHSVYCHDQAVGSLSVFYWKDVTLSESDKSILEIISAAIGVEEERWRAGKALHTALEDSEKRRAEVTALLESAGSVLRHKKLKIAVKSIFSYCRNLLGAASGYVALIDGSGTNSRILFLDSGGLTCRLGCTSHTPVRGLGRQAFHNGRAVYQNNFPDSTWAGFLPPGHITIDNILLAPLEINNEVAGLLALANKPGGFNENDVRMASAFAEILAIAIHNSRTMESLSNSQELFRSVAQTASDAMITVDSRGSIMLWNKAAETMFGYSADEAINKPLTIIMPERFRELHQRGIDRLVNTGKANLIVRTMELMGQKKNKGEFPIELSLSTWKVRKQHYFTGIIRDITERKRAEQAIAAEKERLAVTLRSIGDGVLTTDVEGKILLINRVAENIIGLANDKIRGKPLHDILILTDEKDGRHVVKNPVKMALKSRRIYGPDRYILNLPEKDAHINVSVTCSPIFNTDSVIIGTVLVCRDITIIQKLEEEILNKVKLESLGILAGGIAHDFNNILMSVILNIYLAKMNLSTRDEGFDTLTEAENALMQAKSLTQQLLTFSKGGAPILKTTSIGDLVKDSARFVLRGSNIRCEFYIPDDLWPVEIDEGQISQVINNLIINASQAMPEGGFIEIHAENAKMKEKGILPLEAGNYVKISVRDYGTGIPAEYIKKIFDPYFTTKPKGSGLGLSTSYSIIKNHGGYLSVESESGKGSSFYIFLPASKFTAPLKEDEEKTELAGRGKILVMDDEEDIRKSLGKILANFGYEVDFAEGGTEAIELYKKSKESGRHFDAVIMDLTVPGGMGGLEAIRRLIEIDPEVRAIVSSGYSSDPVMANFREYGFKGVIAKPYKVGELGKVIHGVIFEKEVLHA